MKCGSVFFNAVRPEAGRHEWIKQMQERCLVGG
jgi:hypothetical protein